MGTFRISLPVGFSATAGNWHGVDYLHCLLVIKKKQGPALVFTQCSPLITSTAVVSSISLFNLLIFPLAQFGAGRCYRSFIYSIAKTQGVIQNKKAPRFTGRLLPSTDILLFFRSFKLAVVRDLAVF